MKKTLGVFLIIAGFIISLVGAIMLIKVKSNTASNIAIIGGADESTSIFIAGKIGYPIYGTIIGGIIVFILGLILVLIKKNSNRNEHR